MAITIRVPDPTEEYDAGNQRQIVRAINNVIQQLNAQYKPQGETFNEIEQLSYFLGNAPAKPSGPATAEVGGGSSGGGLPYSRIDVNDFVLGGYGYFAIAPVIQLDPNRGYLVTNSYFPPLPPDFFPQQTEFILPNDPAPGSQVGIVINGYTAKVSAGFDSEGYPVTIDGYTANFITMDGGISGGGENGARTFVYFGDGGYAFGYRDVWYTIATGYGY